MNKLLFSGLALVMLTGCRRVKKPLACIDIDKPVINANEVLGI